MWKNNDEDPKLEVDEHVRRIKHKNVFAKGYTWDWSEEDFLIKKVNSNVSWPYAINDLNGEEK